MSAEILDREHYRLIRIAGFLDGHTEESEELDRLLEEILPAIRNHYVIDLSSVEYVNSSMLGQFMRFLSAAQERGRQLLLLNPPSSVANVLNLTGLSALLSVVESEAEVVERLRKRPTRRIQGENVDYDALASEIEDAMKGGPSEEDADSQIGRILGE